MRVILIGDVVGRPGRKAVKDNLPDLITEFKLDLIIANGENAAGGMGLTKDTAKELFDSGIDIITMGNHVWNKKEMLNYISQDENIIRPANYPPGTPGNGYLVYKARNDVKAAVFNLSGRVFMDPLDCPFRKADEILNTLQEDINVIILDFHAEATSEKVSMGRYLDGKVSAVCGTHTHVQTADECILPRKTAYITDIGMTGPCESVIGFKTSVIISKFIKQIPEKFEVASGLYQFNAVIIDFDERTGEAENIHRIQNYE
ncbi:MAG: TIGR00282 family metallophosphoesterase [Clostridiales bacterium]|nr:TIGR00282 family metallophosphoesterase [Clostridiales bacterium]MCF8023404.1 TIGR00282 family metallophosphoesterase [Clostridiales bacterium]